MRDQPRILIVEDEGVIALSLRRKLEQLGFAVAGVADNCDDALRLASDAAPDLVMVDIVIQGDADGIETAKRLRAQQDVPVVFLTAHSDEQTIARAQSALPYGYLVKPFEARELRTTIELALYRHESQATQRLQAQAIASATVGIAIADARDGERPIAMCNPALERLAGCSAEELQGRPLASLWAGDEEARRTVEDLLRRGVPGRVTAHCVREDGASYFAESSISSVSDHAGAVTHHLVVHNDVTARVNAEKAANRAQRLEAIGTLVGGIAHDLNNALAPIVMGAPLLKSRHPGASRTVEMFEASARRGAEMVRQLLTFAKGAEGERVPVDHAYLLREMRQLVERTFPKSIRLEVEAGGGQVGTILGDPTQLHQVLLNLCVNARDAMPEGGTLTLKAERVQVDEVFANSDPEAVPGDYVVLSVGDTGSGIPPDVVERIFDPFFSTKPSDRGTGLGLSTVAGIVKGHGGFVQVTTRMGRGSTFRAYLPAGGAGAAAPAERAAAPEHRGNGEVVLLVDDDPGMRQVGRDVLRQMNYSPLVAPDGLDGLILLAEQREKVRVVITDLQMPDMDGLAFVRAFRRLLPDVPVIVASGMVDDADKQEFQALGVSRYLDKPFTAARLGAALQDALGRS